MAERASAVVAELALVVGRQTSFEEAPLSPLTAAAGGAELGLLGGGPLGGDVNAAEKILQRLDMRAVLELSRRKVRRNPAVLPPADRRDDGGVDGSG